MLIQTDNDMRQLLREMKVFALVGLSSNPERPSHKVAKYLMTHGYTVIPVNPVETEILGQKCYSRLADIPQKVDVVDCFRKSADIPPLSQDAFAIGAEVLWMQLEVINEEAAQSASTAGLAVVMDRCPKIEHARLMG